MLMKKHMTLTPSVAILVALITGLAGFSLGVYRNDLIAAAGPLFGYNTTTDTLDDDDLQAAYQALKTHYNGTLDDGKLLDGAIKGMVDAAGDKYTVYLNKKESDEFNKELSGDIGGGIGAEIGVRSGQPTIIRLLPDNPAEAAGLNAGDVITKVNDTSTVDMTADKVVTYIKGEVGSSVTITVKRGNDSKQFTITRAEVNNPSVSSIMRGTTGIVTLSRFDQNTVSLFRREVDQLKQRGMTHIVLDLRGNGGGFLDAAPGVAGLWLDDKLVVSVRANAGGTERLNSEGAATLKGMPTVILTNEGTASASEIVTAALKHYKVATIVGEKTFGKGTVQELVPLSGGATLKVTIKRWYTPSGGNVNEKGIEPDVKTGLNQSDVDAGRDPQLEEAIKRVGA